MSTQKQSGAKTLLWSIIMSAPGPLVVGLGLLTGKSTTQLADFVRRSAELLAIVASYAVYSATQRCSMDAQAKKRRLQRLSNTFVGAMMCLAGAIMAVLALLSGGGEKGNVIPGLLIAVLGVIANSIFWRRYTRLDRAAPDAILAVQARLYRAKTLVDISVTLALSSVLIAPQSPLAHYLDIAGSLVVAVYLIWCGLRTIGEARASEKNRV